MVKPKDRSRSVKRVFSRTPGGKTVLHFKAGKTRRGACRLCSGILGGVEITPGIAKSKKVPSRMFAGQLCGRCCAKIIKMKSRIELGDFAPENATLQEKAFLRQAGAKI
jgi:large subunit ribosomal protein L34e